MLVEWQNASRQNGFCQPEKGFDKKDKKKKGGGSQLLRAVVNFTAVYIGCLHCFAMQFHIRQE